MKKPNETFEDGLRQDVAKRLRAALHKIVDRIVDIEVVRHRDRVAGNTGRDDIRVVCELEGHVKTLEWAVARAIVEGDVYIDGHVKDALAAADGPKPKKPPPPPRPIKGRLAGAPQTLMLPMPRIIEGEIEEPGE